MPPRRGPARRRQRSAHANGAAHPQRGPAIAEAVAAIRALESHIETLLPNLPVEASIGAERYTAKLARRSSGKVTPASLREDALAEVRRVRTLMVEEAGRWQRSPDDAAKVPPDLADQELLARSLEAMEADRENNTADFLAQFERLTDASERFVIEKAIATVPKPTTLYIALSPLVSLQFSVGIVLPAPWAHRARGCRPRR